MPLRILHVTPYCESAWAYGGIPRVVGALSHGLARRGHHVTVCATDAHDATSRLRSADRASRIRAHSPTTAPDGVVLRLFPNLSNRAAYRLQAFVPLGFRRFLREHAGTFDLAHVHACRHLPGALAVRVLRRAGVPYVLGPNGTAPIIERRQLAKKAFDVLIGRSMLAGAARVLAVSAAERRQLLALGVPSHSISTVPNPLDLAEFSSLPPRGLARRRWGAGDAPVVLFLGKITPRKNVATLVQAFARLGDANARLVVAGNDMGGGILAQRLVNELSLDRQTVFTGLLRGGERLQALADADVVVYPSEHEVFGLVPFEALLTGTPVIVAGDSGCGDLVRQAGGGLIVPVNEVEPLTGAIRSVLASRDEWRHAATRAATHIRLHYSGGAVSAALEAVYSELVPLQQDALSA